MTGPAPKKCPDCRAQMECKDANATNDSGQKVSEWHCPICLANWNRVRKPWTTPVRRWTEPGT